MEVTIHTVSKSLLLSTTVAAVVWLLLVALTNNTSTPSQLRDGEGHDRSDKVTWLNLTPQIRRRILFIDPKTVLSKPPIALNRDSQMLSCLRTILQQQQLPIGGAGRDDNNNEQDLLHPRVFAHHWDARNIQNWNPGIRMVPIPQLQSSSSCSVWEVGANTHARDTEQFLQQYPTCSYHAYEPIPDFFAQLNDRWAQESRVTPHNYGLGPEDVTFQIPPSQLHGESTYIGDSSQPDSVAHNHNARHGGGDDGDGSTSVTAHIKSFATAVTDAGGQIPTLLHINCEGCEWDMLPAAKQAGFLDDIEVIQFGTHNYGTVGLGNRVWQLCEIRQLLSETHDMAPGGVAFGWERWIKRHSN